MSKIQSESKSQLVTGNGTRSGGCKPLCQRYNLKANHNVGASTSNLEDAVNHYVKDTI